METSISNDIRHPELCLLCKDAECDSAGDTECQRTDAYHGEPTPPTVQSTGDITFWHHAALGREAGWSGARDRRYAAGRYTMAVDAYNMSRSPKDRVSLDSRVTQWVNGFDAAMAAAEFDPR